MKYSTITKSASLFYRLANELENTILIPNKEDCYSAENHIHNCLSIS